MKIQYKPINLSEKKLKVIAQANDIIEEYTSDGFDLTLRQLYYQFVARDLIANKQSEYANLGRIINDGRLAGLVSWQAIIDRTRNLQQNSHWDGPSAAVQSITDQYQIDKWEGQEHRVEVWIEKDALIGVIEPICEKLDVSYFSCRGYTSQSEMWSAAMRLKSYHSNWDQKPVIIHLGDHDPSGCDMSRDIEDRLAMFTEVGMIEVNRIALNMNQIEKYEPPPNPSKISDPRAGEYIKKHGYESWELDALDPKMLAKLIESTVKKYRDEKQWKAKVSEENIHIARLQRASDEMDDGS